MDIWRLELAVFNFIYLESLIIRLLYWRVDRIRFRCLCNPFEFSHYCRSPWTLVLREAPAWGSRGCAARECAFAAGWWDVMFPNCKGSVSGRRHGAQLVQAISGWGLGSRRLRWVERRAVTDDDGSRGEFKRMAWGTVLPFNDADQSLYELKI